MKTPDLLVSLLVTTALAAPVTAEEAVEAKAREALEMAGAANSPAAVITPRRLEFLPYQKPGQVTLTVIFQESAQSFADGKRVLDTQLQRIADLMTGQKIAGTLISKDYNIYQSNGVLQIRGRAEYHFNTPEAAAAFSDLLTLHGFEVSEENRC